MSFIRSLVVLSLCVPILLGGCTSTPMEQIDVLPELTFEHLIKIPVKVANIDYISEPQRGARPWDIANELTTPPDVAMRRYLAQRYTANGADGRLTIRLDKASIAESLIPHENVFLSYIPMLKNSEYTYEIVVHLADAYRSGMPDREVDLRFVRKVVISPRVSPIYRDQRLQLVLQDLILDVDEAMINTLSKDFRLVAEKDIPVYATDMQTKQ